MSDPIRLAVVGTGGIAQLAHIPVLAKARGVRLVALCDNDNAKARALADRFGVPDVYTDLEELLESDALDAVVIATPNHLHEPHALSALRAGVHVLCERPLALTTKGVERVIAAANRVDRKVLVGNNHRFRGDVQALARFLANGELGALAAVRAGVYATERPEGWRRRRAESGGGAFQELGFDLLDLALWLAGSPTPERVSAQATTGKGANAVEDGMLASIDLGPVSLGIDVSWGYVGSRERTWFDMHLTQGSARLAPLRVAKHLNGRVVDVSPSGATQRESAFQQSYRAQLAHFVAVMRGETAYEPPTDQIVVTRLVEAVYRSAADRREVKL